MPARYTAAVVGCGSIAHAHMEGYKEVEDVEVVAVADPVPGALTPDDWRAFLAEYPNVIAHLCGHSHVHRATYVQPMGTRGYWEVITAAIADWPHQMRIVEVHDQDNGWLTITGIALDYSTEGDPLATEGRALGILDFTSNWVVDGSGTPEDRNVRLWIEAP